MRICQDFGKNLFCWKNNLLIWKLLHEDSTWDSNTPSSNLWSIMSWFSPLVWEIFKANRPCMTAFNLKSSKILLMIIALRNAKFCFILKVKSFPRYCSLFTLTFLQYEVHLQRNSCAHTHMYAHLKNYLPMMTPVFTRRAWL